MTKVKISKKLVAFAMTIMMLAVMLMPATAAPDNDEGSITVHKYSGTSLADATANNTGEELAALDPAHPLNNGYNVLEDAEFTLFRLPQTQINAINAAITDTNKVVGRVITTTAAGIPTVVFNLYDSSTSTPSSITVTATAADIVGVETTDAAGQAFFGTTAGSELPDGYYVLVETDTPEGHLTAAASLIRIPLTDSDGERIYDIHVYPKNISDVGLAVKDVDGLSKPVATDDVVDFSLKAKFISATVASAEDLKDNGLYGTASIKETFSNQFQYVGSSLGVYWLDSAGEIDTTAPLLSSEYTNTTLPSAPGGDFTVSLTPAGIDEAIAEGYIGFGLVLKATYIGVPTADAGAEPEAVVNTMSAIMTAPGGEDEEVVTTIHVPSISIHVDKKASPAMGGLGMGGVTFAVLTQAIAGLNYDPSAPAGTYTEAQLTAAGYILAPGSTPTDGKALVATTDAGGQLVFSNLNGYVNTGVDFWLKELVTLPGYQLKDNTIKVSFGTQAAYKAATPTWFDTADNWLEGAQVVESATVTNYGLGEEDPDDAGFSLPLTGGAGTLLFTAVGIVVMLGAAVVYLQGKKRNI